MFEFYLNDSTEVIEFSDKETKLQLKGLFYL